MTTKTSEQTKAYHREYSKKHYLKNKDKYKAKAKIRNAKTTAENFAFVSEYKLSYGCSNCGYNKCSAALDFHHTEDNKEHNIARLYSYSINAMKKEIEKCIVLCSNCHRELHHTLKSIT